MPYAGLSGIQAALAVMHRGLRPDMRSHTPAPLAQLIQVGVSSSMSRSSFEMLASHRALSLEVSVALAQCLISRTLCLEPGLLGGSLPDRVKPARSARSCMQECWQPLPSARPSFSDIVPRLEAMQSDFGG